MRARVTGFALLGHLTRVIHFHHTKLGKGNSMPAAGTLSQLGISGGATAAEIVNIARASASAGIAWTNDGCAAFTWGVGNLAGIPFYDLQDNTTSGDPTKPFDKAYFVPHTPANAGAGNTSPNATGDGWLVVSSTTTSVSALAGILQPGDIVRVYKAGVPLEPSFSGADAAAHSFIVSSVSGSNVSIIDNWHHSAQNSAFISEHSWNVLTSAFAPNGSFDSVIVSRIDPDWVASHSQYNTVQGFGYGDWSSLTTSPPDLAIGTLAVGSSVAAGGTETISFEIVNSGGAPAAATSTKLYLSQDAFIDANDTLINTFSTAALSAGQVSPTVNTSTVIPANLAPGTYHIIAQADSANAVTNESSETNNVFAQSFTVTEPPPPSQLEFQTPVQKITGFSITTGWPSQDGYLRAIADVSGDNLADIVGFGTQGILVSLATGGGNFGDATVRATGFNPSAGWRSDNAFHREVADVNGDNLADIVGFGPQGIWVSLATGGGNFGDATLRATGFNPSTGWSSQDAYPRHLADVNADNMADIVGFGPQGIWVSLALGGGNFGDATLRATGFSPSSGWTSDNTTPRRLADVNGDNRADIVGFAGDGVYVSLATGGGNFANAFKALDSFGSSNAAGGWTKQNSFPRELADIDGDNRADIVGFGATGVWIAFGNVAGTFGTPRNDVASYGTQAGDWYDNNNYPRLLGDVNGDNFADIIGFGSTGVWESLSNGFDLL
jgi:hypothetical protein